MLHVFNECSILKLSMFDWVESFWNIISHINVFFPPSENFFIRKKKKSETDPPASTALGKDQPQKCTFYPSKSQTNYLVRHVRNNNNYYYNNNNNNIRALSYCFKHPVPWWNYLDNKVHCYVPCWSNFVLFFPCLL